MSKEKRDRLFKSGRPFIRSIQIYEDGKYHKDVGICWVAHQKRPFYVIDAKSNQQTFAQKLATLANSAELLIAEDKNKAFKGAGPVALFGVETDGWKAVPHVEFFHWATKRNILRVTVAFLQMMRYRKIGCCTVYVLNESTNLLDRCQEYGVLRKVGIIPNGNPLGDEAVYSIRGKANGNPKKHQ